MHVIQGFMLLDSPLQSVFPNGSFTPLSVAIENNQMCLYGIVDPSESPKTVELKVAKSWVPIDDLRFFSFLGTVIFQGSARHIFMKP